MPPKSSDSQERTRPNSRLASCVVHWRSPPAATTHGRSARPQSEPEKTRCARAFLPLSNANSSSASRLRPDRRLASPSSTSLKAGVIRIGCTRPSAISRRGATKKSTIHEIAHNLRNLNYPSRHESRAVSTLSGELQKMPTSRKRQLPEIITLRRCRSAGVLRRLSSREFLHRYHDTSMKPLPICSA